MNNDLNIKNTKKNLRKFMIFSLIILALLYNGLSLVYDVVYVDIVFGVGIFPKIINIAVSLCDIVSYALCFSVFMYSIYRFGVKSSMPLIYIYSAAALLKYFANVGLHSLVFRYPINVTGFVSMTFVWLLDLIMVVIALFIINGSLSKRSLQTVEFKGIFSKENPLQLTSLFVGIFISATKIIQRIFFDIGYGSPADILEVLWMSVSYLSDVLVCFIVYLVCNFTVKRIYNKNL